MIEKGDRIVVGVSGGADSVCLLYVLNQYCNKNSAFLLAVHINHGIRGEEAARDERFVKELSDHWKIDFLSYSYPVREIAKKQGISEEEAGRKVRYDTFFEVCRTHQCNKIAIAHNRNDNAETILFHLFRGSGITGLTGIEQKRVICTDFGEVTLIRPLLNIGRNEIEAYLRLKEITWQTDSTNLTNDYSRNKIRNKIINYAADEINSGVVRNITEAASQLREARDYIEAEIDKEYDILVSEGDGYLRIPVEELQRKHIVIQKGLILRILGQLAGKRKNIESKHIEYVLSLCQKQVGRSCHLPYGIVAEREYDCLGLSGGSKVNPESPVSSVRNPVHVNIPGRTIIPWKYKIIETEIINYKNNISIPKNSCVKWFDYDKIENAVDIRNRREGDYIQINSSGGNKKIKDYFIDSKIPRRLRDSELLVADGSHIMWITGALDRMSEGYKVDETTKRVLLMKMYDLEESADDK